jgi:transcriptional regulator with XRE-family HTH domain
MNANRSIDPKLPVGAERPFPWRCRHCGKTEVVMTTISYDAEIRHDGRLYPFTVPELDIPVCRACEAKVFTEKVDDQINVAFRSHLRLMAPEEMRAALERINMTQKEASERLGVAEATLSRWLTKIQIQSRAMDNLLRVFFAFPQVRHALNRDVQDAQLGTADITGQHKRKYPARGGKGNTRSQDSAWLDALNGRREKYQKVQDVVQQAGTTWGKERVA